MIKIMFEDKEHIDWDVLRALVEADEEAELRQYLVCD